jgi:hypothetical protein
MMDMVERVARAIHRIEGEKPNTSPFPDYSDDWRDYTPQARAAIEAMRVPTDEMVKAGEEGINSLPALPGHYAEYCWPAMIDAALSPNQKE